MKLVEGRSRYLPVRLLVQITKRNCIGEKLIEALGHLQPHRFFQFQRKPMTDCAVWLNFGRVLVKPGLRANRRIPKVLGLRHEQLPLVSRCRLLSKSWSNRRSLSGNIKYGEIEPCEFAAPTRP